MITAFQTLVTDNIDDLIVMLTAVVTAGIVVWAAFLGLRVAIRKVRTFIK